MGFKTEEKKMKYSLILAIIFATIVSGLKCRTNENCLMMYTTRCQNITCVGGFCVESEYKCIDPNPSPCQSDVGVCSVLDGLCYYPQSSICDDESECTYDKCSMVGDDTVCTHTRTPGCVDGARHEVTFNVMEINKLNVNLVDNNNVRICHNTAYRGRESVSLLSFTPYESKTLRERGTCDNHVKYTIAQNPLFRLEKSEVVDVFPCVPLEAGPTFVFAFPGIPGELFMWSQIPLTPTMVLNEVTRNLRVHGYVVSVLDPLLVMSIDLHFEDLMDKYSPGPYLGMYATCYKNNLKYNPRSWNFYKTWYGTVTALPGSPYYGLTLELVAASTLPQLGFGASGVNSRYSIYAEFEWNVVSQPYNTGKTVNSYRTKAIFMSDATQDFKVHGLYADLFGEPQPSPTNAWSVQLLDNEETIQYCRSFTLYDLLSCRNSSDPYTSLFEHEHDQSQMVVRYKGAIYATSLVPCTEELSTCVDEKVVDSAIFNLTLVVNEHGFYEVTHESTHLDLQVIWENNVWLRGAENGNLKVNFKTRLYHENMHLTNPAIDASTERGYPLFFEETVTPLCQYVEGYCEQAWTVRSKFAKGDTNFNGFKALSWDVRRNDVTVQKVHAHMNLKAFHVGDQSHAIETEQITASFKMYKDRDFKIIYQSEDATVVDGSLLYGLICLDKFDHLDVHIQRVYLCASETADTLPFDPENPTTTGCHTPGIDVKDILIYSSQPTSSLTPNWRDYEYQTLYSPPENADCEGFSFKPQASNPHRHTIEVVWYTQENGGMRGMVELMSEHLLHFSRHVQENEALEHFHFHVECSPGYIYSHTFHACIPLSTNDDDDSFDGYHGIHDDIDNTWFLLFGLFFVFLVVILCFSGALRTYFFSNTGPPTRISSTIRRKKM